MKVYLLFKIYLIIDLVSFLFSMKASTVVEANLSFNKNENKNNFMNYIQYYKFKDHLQRNDKNYANNQNQNNASEIRLPEKTNYQIINILTRNANNKIYTQGLFFEADGNSIYESGGLYHTSTLNHFSFPSLELIKSISLNGKYFAEGIAACSDFIYQLTWREKDILKYQKSDFKLIGKINIPRIMREGWGLASYKDGLLIATDGSNRIFILDCENELKQVSIIRVTKAKNGVWIQLNALNDLIWADDYIYANRYYDSKIYKIDPNTGKVVDEYDMEPLINYEINKRTLTREALNRGDVLNGIAYNPRSKIFLITGKRWGHFYEVKLN